MTKEKIKTALKSILKAIKVMLIILFILTLPFTIPSIPYIINRIQDDYAAKQHFEEVCKFVKENEEVFVEFSEYQGSIARELNTSINVDYKGELQEKRDIVFKYFHTATVGIDSNGDVVANYSGHFYSAHDLTLRYGQDIAKNVNETDKRICINDDMYIYILRTGF